VTRPAFFPFDFFPVAEDEKQRLNWSDFTDLIQRKGVPLQLPAYKRYRRKETQITELADLPIFPHAVPISHPSHEGLIFRVERKGQFDFLAKWVRPDYVAGEFLPGLRDYHPTQLVLNELI